MLFNNDGNMCVNVKKGLGWKFNEVSSKNNGKIYMTESWYTMHKDVLVTSCKKPSVTMKNLYQDKLWTWLLIGMKHGRKEETITI